MSGRRLWQAWILALLLGLCASAQAVQITDDRGVNVNLPKVPKRIVSLLPSLTETVCALGQCQLLVGVDRYSNFPAQVQKLPKLGGGLDPNIEAVVALKPDLVLLATSSPAATRLQALGLTVVALEPKQHADVRRVLETLGQLLAVTDAQSVWRAMDAELTALAQSVPAGLKAKRVYFEVNNAPYAASESSFIGETLARLGVRNIVPAAMGPFPRINPEFVVRASPDVIMVGDASFEGLAQRPGWAEMAAAKRLCVFTPQQSDMMVRPGPRMNEAARLMLQCLQGKL